MPIQAEFIDDDGLKCNDVGGWAEEKYHLIASYFRQFSTGTKNKWPHRAFIDLYAGAGYSRLRTTGKILKKLAGRTLDGRTYNEFPPRREKSILPEKQRIAYVRQYSPINRVDVPLANLALVYS
jgi:hypothetical protein